MLKGLLGSQLFRDVMREVFTSYYLSSICLDFIFFLKSKTPDFRNKKEKIRHKKETGAFSALISIFHFHGPKP